MTSRLGKHLLRASSMAENVGLFALCPCYFADQSHQWLKILVSKVSLNWGKYLKYTKIVYNSTQS